MQSTVIEFLLKIHVRLLTYMHMTTTRVCDQQLAISMYVRKGNFLGN